MNEDRAHTYDSSIESSPSPLSCPCTKSVVFGTCKTDSLPANCDDIDLVHNSTCLQPRGRGLIATPSLVMPTNVEVKASISDLDELLTNAKLLSGSQGK